MKRFLIISSCIGILAAPLVGHGAETRVSIQADARHDVFTGLFGSVWARLSSISPRDLDRPPAVPVAITATCFSSICATITG